MKKVISFVLALLLCMSMPVSCFAAEKAADNKSNKKINAKAVVLMCMDTGDVLYKENEYEQLSPASVTKIMSLLLILEALESKKITLGDKVTATKDAVSMGGSQIWLEVGESMTVEDLLKAVVVASANDACVALGDYIAGSSVGFVKMMNDRAKELGLKHTNFENCTGLDDSVSNHYSCAYDLAVIASHVMKHKLIQNYTTIWLDSLRNGKTELNNTNKLVNTYSGITGLKTGTTSNAGFCIAVTAKRENLNLVAVVLGSDTSKDRFDTAAYLLDTGFANYQMMKLKSDSKKITPVKVKYGSIKSVLPKPESTSGVLVRKGTDSVTYEYDIKKEVSAPVKKGDLLGTIRVMNEKKKIGEIKLVADVSIAKTTLLSIFKNIITKI